MDNSTVGFVVVDTSGWLTSSPVHCVFSCLSPVQECFHSFVFVPVFSILSTLEFYFPKNSANPANCTL